MAGDRRGSYSQIDPEQLNSGQDRLLRIGSNGRNKGNDHGGDIDAAGCQLCLHSRWSVHGLASLGDSRDLELQKLLDTVIDTSAPHDGKDDVGKGVVHEDNVGGFLGDFCTANQVSAEDTDEEGLDDGRE